MSKSEYFFKVLRDIPLKDKRIIDAAVYFFHAEVSIKEAKKYLANIAEKLK